MRIGGFQAIVMEIGMTQEVKKYSFKAAGTENG